MLPRLHALIRLRSKINPINQARHKHRANRHRDTSIRHHTSKSTRVTRPEHGLGAGKCGGDDGGENGLHGEVDGKGRGLEGRELGAGEDFEGDYAGDEGLGCVSEGA